MPAVFVCCASNALGVTYSWDDEGVDHNWSTPANWSPDGAPAADGPAYIEAPAASTPNGPIINYSPGQEASGVFVGGWTAGNATMRMDSGSLVCGSLQVGTAGHSEGVFTMNGGDITITSGSGVPFCVGYQNTQGTLTMNGGTITALYASLVIGYGTWQAGEVTIARVYLNAGEIHAWDVQFETHYVAGSTLDGKLYIGDSGKLVLTGDKRTSVAEHIQNGNILYSGTGVGNIVAEYPINGNTEVSVVLVAPPGAKASNPTPQNNAQILPNDITDLTWTPASSALAQDVYFGGNFNTVNNAVRLNGDIDGSGSVDGNDICELTGQWLQPPSGGARVSADHNDDGKVNLEDFAIVVHNWQAQGDGIFKGHYTLHANSYTPPSVDIGETYYWRIDGVDNSHPNSPWHGDVWSFEVVSLQPNEEWTELFNQTSGWTGADGIFSTPYHIGGRDRTLFCFSDTFLGQVDPVTRRRTSATMVSNSLAVLEGAEPDNQKMTFIYGASGNGSYTSVFSPTGADWPRYWMGDWLVLNNKIYNFAMYVEQDLTKPPGWQFESTAVHRLSIPLDANKPHGIDLENHTWVTTPLFVAANEDREKIIFGAVGVMVNSAAEGAPNPDGYIYVYGYINDWLNKRLVVARVLPEDFEDFGAWCYWNGAAWSTDIESVVGVADRMSSELSVTPLANGKYILVFQEGTIERYVCCRIGESPRGPFGDLQRIYFCPEPDIWPGQGIYTYNAKAHPHLSRPGELLITYNVNGSWDALLNNADIYRPRWLRLSLSDIIQP